MPLTATEVEKHNSRASCWIAIRGNVYDVTDFLDEHPGGPHVLLRCAGKDATDDYESVHAPELLLQSLPSSAFRGSLENPSQLAKPVVPQPVGAKQDADGGSSRPPPLANLINLDDFEDVAKRHLPANAWAYYTSGADDEISKHQARRAYRKVALRPRILRSIPSVDTTTTILGKKVSLPVYLSPVGIAKLAHPEGECALARAAGKDGLVQVVANGASMPIEKIMASRVHDDQPIFWQLYVNKDIKKSEELIRRSVQAGVSAIWLTVDSPVVGKREFDERMNLSVSGGDSATADPGAQGQGFAKVMASSVSPYIDWEILKWLRGITDLPIVIKGIQCVEDAVLAYQHGVHGIVLSNHGGRSQDTAQPPLLTLLEIRRFAPFLIGGKMQIFVDGGIRRGTDVLKALALGATAVGLGRPFLYSLSAGYGEAGTRKVIDILRREIESNMVFLGATKLSELDANMINAARLERDLVGSVKL